MFYVNKKGEVKMMEGALNVESLAILYGTKFQKKDTFDHVITYIYYMYSTSPINIYKHIFIEERKATVVRDQRLFSWLKKPTFNNIEKTKGYNEVLDDYFLYCLTPSEQMMAAMEARMEKYKHHMNNAPLGDPKEEDAMFKALLSMQKIYKEYEKGVHVEKEQEAWRANMRLFEVPEDQWQQ